MSRFIAVAALTPRNIPEYYVIDTATGQRVRAYDCELWARHEAKELNRSVGRRKPINDSGGTDGR